MMSHVFEIDDETVWSPSLRVGELYVRMLRSIADILEIETGLTATASDVWEIDIDIFEVLVRTVNETYLSSNNQVFKILLEGVLAPSIIMLERGGRPLSPGTSEEVEFYDWAHRLSMPM